MSHAAIESSADGRSKSDHFSLSRLISTSTESASPLRVSFSKSKAKTILLTSEKRASMTAKKHQQKKVYFSVAKERTSRWKLTRINDQIFPIQRWKFFILLPLAYEVWAFPYRLALAIPSVHFGADLTLPDLLSDLVIFLDILLHSCASLGNGALNRNFASYGLDLSRNIFGRQFLFLIAPSIPFWVATYYAANDVETKCTASSTHRAYIPEEHMTWSCILSNHDLPVILWWASSGPRLIPRLIKMLRDMKAMENNLEITVRMLQITKFAFLIFVAAHWVGCIFYFIARVSNMGPNTWVYDMEHLLPLYSRFAADSSFDYLLCLYKGFNALTSLEYIVPFPNHCGELIFCIIVMVIAIWLQGIILGTILHYMVEKDPVAEAHQRQMEELAQFVDSKNLPQDLSCRLFKYFKFQHQKAVENRASSCIQLPRSLAIKLSECKYRGVIDKCTSRGEIFFGCDFQFLNALLMKLKVVFYMPNEEIFKKDDLSRELCFVYNGACHLIHDEKVKRVVRDDVPNMAPVLGELSFFLGILQPMAVRAQPDGDVQLLVLVREDSNELFDNYPEQLEIICGNILCSFGLDHLGHEAVQGAQDEDVDTVELKNIIKQAISKQHYDAFAALTFAAKAGDVETVRDLLRRGTAINGRDYDGRSAFASACYEGSYKVVELFLEEGVDTNTKNRWMRTPLECAMGNRQGPVVELLLQWKACTDLDKASEKLRNAASRGDADQLRRLLDNGVNPDDGDYDSRTAMHVACSKGQYQLVENLIAGKANVNCVDRWGNTPLQYALNLRHQQLVSLLRAKGATLSESQGWLMVCDAAARGDVQALNLLIEYAGLQKNVVDLDMRTPLHRAVEQAKLPTVSYLLGMAAKPNLKDRWGQTPLDLALRGRTLYHMYCARLLYGWGGRLGVLDGSEEGQRLIAEMKMHSMDTVRMVVDDLIVKGCNKRIVPENQQHETLKSWEATMVLVEKTKDVHELLGDSVGLINKAKLRVLELFDHFESYLVPCLIAVPTKSTRQGTILADEFKNLFQDLGNADLERQDPFGDDEAMFGIDSDEEEKLHEDLNRLIDAQERLQASRSNAHKFMANSFQKISMRITELQDAFSLVCSAFRGFRDGDCEPCTSTPDALHQVMERLSIRDVSEFAMECMIEDGLSCLKAFGSSKTEVDESEIPIKFLIAGSEGLRSLLFNIHTDAVFCALKHTSFGNGFADSQLKDFCKGGRLIECTRIGAFLFNPQPPEKRWCVMISGKVKVTYENFSKEHAKSQTSEWMSKDIRSGDLFAGHILVLSDGITIPIKFEVSEPCSYIELQGECVDALLSSDRKFAGHFYSLFSEPWRQHGNERSVTSDNLARLESVSEQFGVSSIFFRLGSVNSDAHDDCGEPENSDSPMQRGRRSSGQRWRRSSSASPTRNGFVTSFKTASRTIVKFLTPTSSAATNQEATDIRSEVGFADSMGVLDTMSRPYNAPDPSTEAPTKMQDLSEMELHSIKVALWAIENLWRDMSLGAETVQDSTMKAIHHSIGEIGSELFRKLFLGRSTSNEITQREFWVLWMQYLSNETFNSESEFDSSVSLVDDLSRNQDEHDKECSDELLAKSDENEDPDKNAGCYDVLLSRYSPGRRIKHKFFDGDTLERFETSFYTVAGDLKSPIPVKRVPEFLQLLLPSFPRRFSSYNVNETLEIFGRNGAKSKELHWTDIRKVLREKKGTHVPDDVLFIHTAFNPSSTAIGYWQSLIAFIAVYHFFVVPVRISFLPWPSMLDVRALCTDLVADVLTLLNIAILANTAYMNARAIWVVQPSKLVHRVNIGFFVAAIPLDWFAFSCGASNQYCCWLRLPKLALPLTLMMSKSKLSFGSSSSSMALLRLACIVTAVIHVGACVWFYIGVQYENWYPSKAISWYHVSSNLTSHSYTNHDGKFGMGSDASVWEQYLLSFYWVATTMTSTGLVGDVLPSNMIEISFCIILMVLNLTLFRYVTGDVSSIVMKADERIIAVRSKLEAVETLLHDKRIGKDLQDEIRGYFRVSESQDTFDQSALFSKISHNLAVEVAAYTSREYIDNVAFFHGCAEKLLESISVLLRPAQFAPEEFLFRFGEIAHDMYIVISGSVDELSEKEQGKGEKAERILREGHATGELAFFFGIRHFVGARASSRTGAVCLRLPRAQFLPLLKMFPDDEERIAQAALTSFDGRSHKSPSKKSQSIAQRSHASGRSKPLKNSEDSESEAKVSESCDSDDSVAPQLADGMNQRLEALRLRRRHDHIDRTLFLAAKGDLPQLKKALENFEVNMCNGLKRTPLHVAASEGQLEVVRYLVDNGADINCKDAFSNTCLNDAVRHRHDEVAKLLRERGAILVLDGTKAGVLMCQAASEGNIVEVKRLIDNRVSPSAADDDGRTALHLAASEGHQALVEFLIEKNARVDCRDRFCSSPLDDAVRDGNTSIQRLLRACGASVDVASSAQKLCEYASSGNLEGVKMFVENGADPLIGNYCQRTAAHLAASNGMISVLDYLMSQPSYEANPVDDMGGTPLEDARRHGMDVAALLLERRGGIVATESNLKDLKQIQDARIKRVLSLQRSPDVQKVVNESIETKGYALLRDAYLPNLRSALEDLEAKTKLLHTSIQPSIAVLRGVLSYYGLWESSELVQLPAGNISVHKIQKVIDNVSRAMSSFAASAASAIEALNADFSRYKAMRVCAKALLTEASTLRAFLKVSVKVLKKCKKPLQELRTLSGPRPRSRERLKSVGGFEPPPQWSRRRPRLSFQRPESSMAAPVAPSPALLTDHDSADDASCPIAAPRAFEGKKLDSECGPPHCKTPADLPLADEWAGPRTDEAGCVLLA